MKAILCPLIDVIGFLTISIVPIFAEETTPVLKQFEVDEYNNVIRPYGPVDEKLSEIVVENVDHLRLECHANYPVQWIYNGNGVPIINTNLSRSSALLESERRGGNIDSFEYAASVFLSPLREHHTGQYQCSRTDYTTVVPNLYIYVPGKDFFTSTQGKTIYINPNVTSITIPCSVTHPSVRVLLYKIRVDRLITIKKKSDDAIAYDPRKGYRINVKQIENPEDRYLCRGNYNSLDNDVEYIIAFRQPSVAQAPDNLQERCTDETCKQCENHSDCAPSMNCHTDFKCQDPCTYSIRCGKYASCKVVDNRPLCYCESASTGDPHKECWILEY